MTSGMSPPFAAAPPPDALAEQAAQWIVLLTDDDAAERERAHREFDDWKRADPRHAAAAADMEALLGRVRTLRGQAAGSARPVRAALDAARAHAGKRQRARRRNAAFAAVALVLGAALWAALGVPTFAHLTADLRTSTGQWRMQTLPDGSRITLGSDSAVDLRYDSHRREIELLRGDILIEVASDAGRPFLVDTSHGRIRALGTRFVVERGDDATRLGMIESATSVQAAAQRNAGDEAAVRVHAGEQVRITATSVGAVRPVDAEALEEAWRRRQLVVDDRPLPEVLDTLRRHRPGMIRYDRAQIAHIRVSAVLPLDAPDRALALLQASFPALRVRTYTPYLVLVDAPPRAPR